jgi:protein-S-isoprenylcysteine O-methyltransferase Ste14
MLIFTRYLAASLALLLFGFLLFRVLARRDYLNEGKLTLTTSFLEFVIFAFHANMIYLFIPVNWPQLPPLSENTAICICSKCLIIIGLAIVFGAMIPLGYNRTMGLKSHKLQTSGLYKFTRNPQVLGYYIVLFGFAVSYPSLYTAGWILLFCFIGHIMITTEEEYLRKIYRERYEYYCKEVPRYITIYRHKRAEEHVN